MATGKRDGAGNGAAPNTSSDEGKAPGQGAEGGEKPPLVEYPGPYTFKVMGLQSDTFVDHVRALFARVLGTPVERDSISEQPSSRGKYVSLNVTVVLVSEAQRRALYADLHADARVVYYL